ncbi:MAG: T9SS type A sorting domain-containing protein, partial [Hymenobacter sp.]
LTNQAGPPASYGPPLANGFLAQLTPAGTWARAWLLGSSGPVSVAALTRPSSGSIVVAGFSLGGANFGSLSLAASGPFVAQLSGTALPTQPSAAPSSFALLPNPAHAQVYLTWPGSAAVGSVQLIDALGREVCRQLVPASASNATLEVAGLAPGLYIVRCGSAAQRLLIE